MSSELKLSLENFQSISRGEMIFHKGLNFIIGQSNSGKSATFRALKVCLSNPAGSQRYIKKGTRKSSVKLEYNGNQIIWNRTSKESSYTINGEDFLKTGKSNAINILENESGFATSEFGLMNLEEELQLPFPFELSSSDLFRLYENVFCVSDSATILKTAKEFEDSTKSEISTLELDINKVDLKLEELDKFRKEIDLEKLKSYLEILKSKNNLKIKLEEGLPIIKKAVLADSINLPSVKEFCNKINEYKDKLSVLRNIERLKRVLVINKKLNDIIPINLAENLEFKLRELRELSRTAKNINELSKIDVQIKRVESKLPELENLINLNKIKEQCLSLSIELPVKDFENLIEKYDELKKYKNELEETISSCKLLQVKLKNKTEEIKDLEEKLASYDVCPLCHRPLEGE